MKIEQTAIIIGIIFVFFFGGGFNSYKAQHPLKKVGYNLSMLNEVVCGEKQAVIV